MRARELSQRQKEAENAKRLEDWREQREKRKLELQAELRGDLSKEEEEELIEKLKKREGQSAKLRAASIDRNKKAMTLEDAFAQIRQATGVTVRCLFFVFVLFTILTYMWPHIYIFNFFSFFMDFLLFFRFFSFF